MCILKIESNVFGDWYKNIFYDIQNTLFSIKQDVNIRGIYSLIYSNFFFSKL